MHAGARAYAPVPNAWGRKGATTATLSKLNAAELKVALETAYAHAHPKKRPAGARAKRAKSLRAPR